MDVSWVQFILSEKISKVNIICRLKPGKGAGIDQMEQRTLRNVNNCFEYQHLLLLGDIWWSKF
jgi:hypothetical protein